MSTARWTLERSGPQVALPAQSVATRVIALLTTAARQLRRALTPVRLTLAGIFAVVTAVWTAASFRLYDTFREGLDLLIFSQAAASMSQGHLPYSSAKGLRYMLFADHFHPLILVLGPLYRIWPSPQMLLLTQAACIGAAAAIAASCAAQRPAAGSSAGASTPIPRLLRAAIAGVAVAVAPGIQAGGLFAFHEVALGLPLLAMACRAFVARRRVSFFLWSLPLLLVKEDGGILVAGLGLAALCIGWRRLAMVMLGTGAVWTLLCIKVIIPLLHGGWSYDGALPSTLDAAFANLSHNLFGPNQFGWILILLIICCGASGVTSPLLIAIVPNVLSRAVTSVPAYLHGEYHYNMLISVICVFAALDAGRRHRWIGELRTAMIMMLGIGLALGSGQLVTTLTGPVDHRSIAARECAVAAVPAGQGVVVDWTIGPRMAVHHDPVQEIPAHPDPANPTARFPTIDWLVVDESTLGPADPDTGTFIDQVERAGWAQTARCDGFVVLHKNV